MIPVRTPISSLLMLALLATLPTLSLRAQETTDSDPWRTLRLLEGSWQAEIDGTLGSGKGLRRYQFRADGRYLEVRHASIRLPQEKSPGGDYHRQLGVFSHDRTREAIVLREFMVEGVVARSPCTSAPMRLVCNTEHVESGEGIRARLTIEFADPYQFTETYELQFPGSESKIRFSNHWTRIPDLRD